MTNASISKGFSGHVFVSVVHDEQQQCLEREISRLRQSGWIVSDDPNEHACDMALVELSHRACADPEQATIVLCRNRADAEKHGAIEPDGFAILAALGGGRLEQDLAASVESDIIVDTVLIGLNWVMIRAGEFCGIARSPARGTEGARTIRPRDGFGGQTLKSLATMLCASDPLSRSIGLAAINAFWNRPTSTGDGQARGFDRFEAPGDGLVIVGGFRDAARRLSHARIVEREPKPGDIPVEEATPVIAGAKALVITGQTLMNGSLESLLRLSQAVKRRMLFGPSVTLSPVLLDHGLDELCGFAVWDHDASERFICESGAMIMRDDLTQARLLCRAGIG